MIRKADLFSADLTRIPGLYRRWELPEILKNHRSYRIENAGAHQDGTPLVAVYADADADASQSDDQHSASTTDIEAVPPLLGRCCSGLSRGQRRRPC